MKTKSRFCLSLLCLFTVSLFAQDVPPAPAPDPGLGGLSWPEIIAAIGAVIILARLIVKLTPTPADDSFLEKVITFLKHVGLNVKCLPFLLSAFAISALCVACGSTGHVGSTYNPTTGDLGANAGVGNTNYTVDVGGSYNVETGQLGPITLTVTFKDAPDPGVVSVLADAGAIPRSTLRAPRSFELTIPNLRDPNSREFIALRAALAAGATITRAP